MDIRQQFQQTLDAFYQGEIEFADLERKLVGALQFEPALAKPLGELLNKAFKARRIPNQVYLILNQHIQSAAEHAARMQAESAPATSPDSASEAAKRQTDQADPANQADAAQDEDPDKTQITHRPGKTAPPAQDATVVSSQPARPQPAEETDKTVITQSSRPAKTTSQPASGRAGSGGLGISGGDAANATGQTGPTSQTSQKGQTGTTGSTGRSSWSHPEQWSGEDRELKVGDEIKDRFVLEAELGRGGMGTVFKALDRRKQEAQDRFPYVAIKVLNKDFKEHPESLKALQREARKSQSLAHPNIITVFDFDKDGQNVYMTMELLEGQPLDEYIRELKGVGLDKDKAFTYIRGMCNALAYAHSKNVVHSDFKPGNVFLTKEGAIKVLDFGIAQAAKQSEQAEGEKTLFDAGELGALTPAYASLEMLDGDNPAPQDDIYALACVAYELLTGKHPYGKKRASKARKKGMLPERVRGLSKAQWRGLQRGLAFERTQRSESVDVFLRESQVKAKFPVLLLGGLVGGITAITLGVFWYLEYAQEQKIQQLLADANSQDEATTAAALKALPTLQKVERDRVLDGAKTAIIDYYEQQIEAQTDTAQGRYNYTRAEQLLQKLQALYEDSAKVSDIREQLADRKAKLLEQMDKDFTRYLRTGQLLPDPAGQNISQVLEIIAQIDPNDSRLSDEQLAIAYENFADQALKAAQFERADALLAAGLERFPQRTSMLDLRDRIGLVKDTQVKNQRIAALQSELQQAAKQIENIQDFAAVRASIKQLAELQPDSKTVLAYQQRLQKLLSGQLDTQIQARQWEAGRGLLSEFSDLLSAEFRQAASQRIQQAQQQHQQNIQDTYEQLMQAAQNQRLTLPPGDNAQDLLQQLYALDAGTDIRQQAQAVVVDAYQQISRELRMDKRWDEARKQLQKGLQEFDQEAIASALQAELEQIDLLEKQAQADLAQAERERIERERQQKITQYQQNFNAGLQAGEFSIQQVRQQLQILDSLSMLAPTDPLNKTGQAAIAQRLDQQIQRLLDAGELQQALALSQQGEQLMPGEQILGARQTALQQQIEQQQAARLAQQISQQKNVIDALLAQQAINQAWLKKINQAIDGLRQLSTEQDAYIATTQRTAAQRLLDKIADLRARQRFTDARQHLQWAESLGAQQTALQAEQKALAQAEQAFKQKNEAEAERAKIEGLKRTLITQAQANKVTAARATLKSLQDKLPKQDEFLQKQAPEAIAKAYLRLATSSAKRKRYAAAEKLIRAGLKIAPQMTELQQALQTYRTEAVFSEAMDMVKKLTPKQGKNLTQKLQQLRELDADNYANKEASLARAVVSRIQQLAKTDNPAAEALLQTSKKIFPQQKRIQQMKLAPPVKRPEPPKQPEPVKRPEPTKPDSPKVVKQPDKPPSPAKVAGQDPCKPKFAGYGRSGRATCYDKLPGGLRGPRMVVVPGKGAMRAYAIGKYEVSIQDYNNYCKASKACKGRRGNPRHPLTGISLQQANAYLAWLKKTTGFNYRLPKDSEWLYAAKANSRQSSKDYNCQLVVNGKTIKGLDLVAINQGKSNKWGLVNYVGNAQEWVRKGGGVGARGGQYTDKLSECDVSLYRNHNGAKDKTTGFRVMRELSGG